jgi:hypothetical protein
MKKEKWWSLLILVPMLFFVGYHYMTYFGEAVHFFPQHLLTSLFCAATMIIYPLFIFHEKRLRLIGVAISIAILLAASVWGIMDQRSHTYDTSMLSSGGETCGIEYDDSYTVSLEDESFGKVWIAYEEGIEDYLIKASFEKTGDTKLILTAPDGTAYYYALTVERYSYHVERIQ